MANNVPVGPINNGVDENPESNRLARTQEALKYHSPVEEDIRAYEARAASLQQPAPQDPNAPPQQTPAPAGSPLLQDPTQDPGNQDASAPAQPPAPFDHNVDDTAYQVQQKPDGYYALSYRGPQDTDPTPLKSPVFLGDKNPNEDQQQQSMFDKFMNYDFGSPADLPGEAADLAVGAFKGYGGGLAKFGANALRAVAGGDLGTHILGKEKAEAFDQLAQNFTREIDGVVGDSLVGEDPKSTAGKIGSTIGEIGGQYVLPAYLGYRGLVAAGASPLAATFIADGVSSFLGVAPEQENLSNMIPEGSEKLGWLKDLMATSPDDPDWVNRSRNAVEAMGTLLAGEGVLKGGKEISQVIVDNVGKVNKFIKDNDIPGTFQNAFKDFMSSERGAIGPFNITRSADNAAADTRPVFYSAVENAADSLPAKVSGQQAIQTLVNTPGVKADEMKWIGLDDYLKGKQSVTKDEIKDFVAANNVELKEVTLGSKTEMTQWEVTRPDGSPDGMYASEQAANRRAEAIFGDVSPPGSTTIDNTKYSGYSTPGGTNYREVLVQLPPKKTAQSAEDYIKQYRERFPNAETTDDEVRQFHKDGHAIPGAGKVTSASDTFRSSHFNEPNVLAHTRLADHTTADGGKTLMVEEIQSDWHQAGRKKGYSGDKQATPEDAQKFFGIEDETWGNLNDEQKAAYLDEMKGHRDFKGGSVPDAPFKKTWPELMFKRVLREAAEKGYESLSWTTGKTQANRFKLSNQVEELRYNPETGAVAGRKKADGELYSVAQNVKPEQLPEYVGKEAADKLLNSPTEVKKLGNDTWHHLSGVDLEVGDKGMAGFYDKILPDYAKKYVKKWGGSIEKTKLGTAEPFSVMDPSGKQVEQFATEAEAKDAVANYGKGYKINADTAPEVWNIPITAAMRESVMKGQPLFQAAAAGAAIGGVTLSANDAQASEGSAVADALIHASERFATGGTLDRAIKLLSATALDKNAPVVSEETVGLMRAAAERTGNATTGIDFNLSRIDSPEQIDDFINQVSQVYADPINKAKGGVQTFDETQLKADMTRKAGFDVDAVLKRQPAEAWPAHKIKAARDIFIQQTELATQMAREIKEGGNNSSDALIAFRRQLAVTAALQAQIKGAQTEAARALSQFRMSARSPIESRIQISELIQASGGGEVNENVLNAFLNAVDNGGEDAAATFARQGSSASSTSMVYEAWINSLLGAPTTHIVNMSGNALAAVQGVMERYAAAGIGSVERAVKSLVPGGASSATIEGASQALPQGGVTFAEAHAYATGMATSTWDALRAFGKAMKTGQGSDVFGKLEYHGDAITTQNINQLPIMKSIAGRMGKDEVIDANSKLAQFVDYMGEYYYRLPGRFLMGEDELFKTLNYRAELNARATREVSDMAHLPVEQQTARYNEIMSDPQVTAPDIHLGSIDTMREFTFSGPAGPGGQRFKQFLGEAKIGDFAPGKIVVPFFNVINNIMKFTAARVPGLGLLNKNSRIYQDLFSGDAARRQIAMGKWTVGGSILGLGAWMNMNGMATGRMTDNPKLRQVMELQGKKAYSIVIPMPDGKSKVFQYNRMDPIGMSLGIASTTAEVMANITDQDQREMVGIAAVSAVLPYLEDKSYFQGVAQFFNAVFPQFGDDNSRTEALSKYLVGVASSAPGALLGPLAPNTPASRWASQRLAGDNVKRSSEPDPYRTEKDAWGDDVLVPNGTAYRAWESLVKNIMSGTPGLSKDLPARKNLWGEDLTMENGLTGDSTFSPIASSTLKYNASDLEKTNLPQRMKEGYFYGYKVGQDMTPEQFKQFVDTVGIDGEMERLGAPVGMPAKRLGALNGTRSIGMPVELSDKQYDNYLVIMNKMRVPNDADPQKSMMNMREFMDWTVKQPEYARLPDDGNATGSKGDILRSIQNKFKDAAANIFFRETHDGPALFKKSVQLKMQAQNTGVQ